MAGIALGDSILASALGAMGPATVSASFPQFQYEWDPSQAATDGTTTPATPSTGSAWSDFLLRSVVRPRFQWGQVVYDPGAGAPDWSQAARLAAWSSAFAAAGVGIWILVRAFGSNRSSNPRVHHVATRRLVSRPANRVTLALARARRAA